MLRRTLFVGLGVAVLVPSVVLAAPEDPVGKVIHRLRKIKTLSENEVPIIRLAADDYETIRMPQTNAEFDALIGYMAVKFTKIPSQDQVREAFTTLKGEVTAEQFRSMPQSVLPIMAARQVLSKWKVHVQANGLTNWSQFVVTYSKCLPNG